MEVPTKYIIFINDMCADIMISVIICDNESNIFFIKIELNQHSVLSPYIFILIINVVIKDIQGNIC
jgi:hypothetical protein